MKNNIAARMEKVRVMCYEVEQEDNVRNEIEGRREKRGYNEQKLL